MKTINYRFIAAIVFPLREMFDDIGLDSNALQEFPEDTLQKMEDNVEKVLSDYGIEGPRFVKITGKPGDNFIRTIKSIREYTDMSLKSAKYEVDELNYEGEVIVKTDTEYQAKALSSALENLGYLVEIFEREVSQKGENK